jgi:hypothetical protein
MRDVSMTASLEKWNEMEENRELHAAKLLTTFEAL